MKRELMDILCCPVCKGDLELKIAKQVNGDIIEGELICHACKFPYRISEGIPNLLPPELQE